MQFERRDGVLFAAVAALVGVLCLGAGKGKGKEIPRDERHLPLYEAVKSGRTHGETELVCTTCHGRSSIPLPENHPPKEQCLVCHLLKSAFFAPLPQVLAPIAANRG